MPLNTTNLISTPEITGNIGQCTSNVSIINGATRENIFIVGNKSWITNSCTGVTENTYSWSFSSFAVTSMVFGAILLFIVVTKYLFFKN